MTTPVYGCHNRKPFKDDVVIYGEPMRSGGRVFPVINQKIPFTMSRTCQYTKTYLGQKDPKCVGCFWRAEINEKVERDFYVFRDWKEGDPVEFDMIQATVASTRSEADSYLESMKGCPTRHYIVQVVKG